MRPLEPAPYTLALRSIRKGLLFVACLSAVISLLMLTGSIYMLQVYDRVLSSGSISTLIALFGIVIMMFGFLSVFDGLRMRLLSRLSLQVDDRLARLAFRADMDNAHKGRVGTNRSDLQILRRFLAGPATLAIFDLPFTLIFIGVLFLIHPILGLMTLVGMMLAAGLAVLNRMVLQSPMEEAEAPDRAREQLAEAAVRGSASLTALGMRSTVTERWHLLHNTTLFHHQRGTEPSGSLAAMSRSLRMLLQSALLTAGAWLVIDGAMSAGAIVAASILSGRALAPVDQLIGQWQIIVQSRRSHDRLVKLQAPEMAAIDLPPLTGALQVEELTCFAPKRRDGATPAKILDRVSFSLAPGDGLGLIGASASGKSTLARAIVGAVLPDAGDVRIDGASLRHWDPDKLGRQIGYLPQRIDLLPGSLRDNIARFDANATDAEVIEAAKSAGVHEMILRLPDGYATDLAQADIPLSGGQIQRIGLARALFGNPKLLVLDEPNAHLDMAGEAALTRALQHLRDQGVTIVVMAHRAGALAAVDRLIVLEGGQIVQDGPRNDILAEIHSSRTTSVPATMKVSALPQKVQMKPQGACAVSRSKPTPLLFTSKQRPRAS